jgi:hypothetical protein
MKKLLGLTLVTLLLVALVAPPVDAGWDRGGHGRWERAPRQEYRGNAGCPACGFLGGLILGGALIGALATPAFGPPPVYPPRPRSVTRSGDTGRRFHTPVRADSPPIGTFGWHPRRCANKGGHHDARELAVRGGIADGVATFRLCHRPVGRVVRGRRASLPLGALSVLPRALGGVRKGVRSPAHSAQLARMRLTPARPNPYTPATLKGE